ncbi:hypothetical protein B0J11DRAFT_517551 [Dendryphion nanum]|uniref:Secreted protein n=1 Tax=Dendryphion nanum TaxID=256645 RepID=A0A9P9IYG2_9PLEO|nr:hypothetical protein B0J11DRAFT_517551 [Dendryphion nanum]
MTVLRWLTAWNGRVLAVANLGRAIAERTDDAHPLSLSVFLSSSSVGGRLPDYSVSSPSSIQHCAIGAAQVRIPTAMQSNPIPFLFLLLSRLVSPSAVIFPTRTLTVSRKRATDIPLCLLFVATSWLLACLPACAGSWPSTQVPRR